MPLSKLEVKQPPHRLIQIKEVSVRGNPPLEQGTCLRCNGETLYSLGSWESHRFNRHIQVDKMWAYRCTNEECGFEATLPEVSNELKQLIKIEEEQLASPLQI